jgi:hypothetical protein
MLGEKLFAGHRGICQAGSFGEVEMVTFYAYRGRNGEVETGV